MQLHIWYHQLNHSNALDYYITKQVQQFKSLGLQDVSLDITLSAIDHGHQASVRLNADGNLSYLQADADNIHHAVDHVITMVAKKLKRERCKDGLDTLLEVNKAS